MHAKKMINSFTYIDTDNGWHCAEMLKFDQSVINNEIKASFMKPLLFQVKRQVPLYRRFECQLSIAFESSNHWLRFDINVYFIKKCVLNHDDNYQSMKLTTSRFWFLKCAYQHAFYVCIRNYFKKIIKC